MKRWGFGDGVRVVKGTNRGFVLVSVLWVLALLTVVALGFARRATLERKMAWYALDHAKALQMARGAVEHGMAELANKAAVDGLNEQAGYTGLDQRWARPVDLLKKVAVYQASGDESFENDICEYRITDCESRLSINHAPREALVELDGMNFQLIRKIMARRESPNARDQVQRFMTVEELRTLADIDDADWFGRDPGPGLRDALTVWGDSRGTVNINTASEAVLRCIPDVPAPVIDKIIRYRKGADGELGTQDDRAFRGFEEIATYAGLPAEALGGLRLHGKTRSTYFTVDAVATSRQGKIRAHCSVTVAMRSGNRPRIMLWREDVAES